ncbi:outer membrane protein [Legionella lytica]|uniref:Outer membrane protein n=1 Tax=Legionella lytica TaxID=96232 RepID=A0ABW8D9Z4_9GAMM
MQVKSYVLGLLMLTGYAQGFAGTMATQMPNHAYHPYAVFTAAADFTRTGRSQTLSLLPPFNNHYTNTSTDTNSADLGFGIGIEGRALPFLSWQAGVSGYWNTPLSREGDVWQFALPEFNNFHYHYKIQSSRVMAIAKLLTNYHECFHPYLSGELGAAFNRSRSYYEKPLIEEAVAMPPFSDHTQSSFAWGVGAGIDVDVWTHLRVGIGYQFADLGQAKLGLSPAEATKETLSNPNLYTHQLRFQLTAVL